MLVPAQAYKPNCENPELSELMPGVLVTPDIVPTVIKNCAHQKELEKANTAFNAAQEAESKEAEKARLKKVEKENAEFEAAQEAWRKEGEKIAEKVNEAIRKLDADRAARAAASTAIWPGSPEFEAMAKEYDRVIAEQQAARKAQEEYMRTPIGRLRTAYHFAVSSAMLINFLSAKEVRLQSHAGGAKLDSEELAARVKSFTVQVICEQSQKSASRK